VISADADARMRVDADMFHKLTSLAPIIILSVAYGETGYKKALSCPVPVGCPFSVFRYGSFLIEKAAIFAFVINRLILFGLFSRK